jgi:hypothetical protein
LTLSMSPSDDAVQMFAGSSILIFHYSLFTIVKTLRYFIFESETFLYPLSNDPLVSFSSSLSYLQIKGKDGFSTPFHHYFLRKKT